MIEQGKIIKWKHKKLGFFTNDGRIFVMPRKSKHYFRLHGGWGANLELLKDLDTNVICEQIRIVIDGGSKILITTPQNWLNKGIHWQTKGMDKQLILREQDFQEVYK